MEHPYAGETRPASERANHACETIAQAISIRAADCFEKGKAKGGGLSPLAAAPSCERMDHKGSQVVLPKEMIGIRAMGAEAVKPPTAATSNHPAFDSENAGVGVAVVQRCYPETRNKLAAHGQAGQRLVIVLR